MLRALTNAQDILKAQSKFKSCLYSELTVRRDEVTIGHRGGGGPRSGLRSNGRIWFLHYEEKDAAIPRHWNAFGLTHDLTTRSSNDIIVELNIPLKGHSKSVGGFFARDSKSGEIALLHSGKVGGGKKGVGKHSFLEWYDQRMVLYENPEGSDEKEEALLIGKLESEDFVEKVADFVVSVARFKAYIDKRILDQINQKELRKKIAKNKRPRTRKIEVVTFERDQKVVMYVKRRAGGRCELCGSAAPFKDVDGEPFLECHHIQWLANGGYDSPDNAVALCPNCHRKMHVQAIKGDIQLLKRKASS